MLTFPHFTPHFERKDWVLPRVLEHQAVHRPDRPFLSWTDTGPTYTFAETNRVVNRLAHGFRRLGVTPGDKVALFLPNSVEFVFAWFALQKIGAVEVAVADSYKGRFLEHPLTLCRAVMIVTTRELAPQLVALEDALVDVTHVILLDSANGDEPEFKRIKTIRFDALFTNAETNPDVPITPRDPAAILFTSGTTGASKAVLMPHSQFYFFAEEDVQLVRLKSHDVYMTGFPLIHGNAQFLTVYPCLIAGAHCVLYPKFSASDFIGRVKRSGCTVTNLLGATMAFICAQPVEEGGRDHKLRRIYAAPLSRDLAGVFTERFGVREYVDGFGQTEISNIFMTPPDEPRPEGACGALVDQWFEVRLADPETGEDVPKGAVGELLVRNKVPGIMSDEYFGMPEKTVEAWRYLWFHTGDAMRRDAEGWYYFVDRVKDALRRRGENISSFEVEAVIREHPAVAECAVIAVKADEKAGEDEVMALIVARGGETISYPEIIEWCDARMPHFMVPRFLEQIEELPRTPSEKVKKKELRERGVGPATFDRLKAGVLITSEKSGKAAQRLQQAGA
jgi:crotonobetaine/carnitine-CoA ligase